MQISLEESDANFELFYQGMQADRSVVYQGENVPLHHHDGNEGFLYILSGKMKITTYAGKKSGDDYLLELALSRVYKANDYVVLTKAYNVHEIEVLEDGVILDVFSTKALHQSFQKFLTVVRTLGNGSLLAKAIASKEANIPQRMLDAHFKQIKADDLFIKRG